ncbi:hypothetical protein D8B26_000975 [Coccidioides posadasii str. Silveira]|uniref:uncharacterized protein n=1 Tax=Coccidioides posadasii (strain RMSCC 757 / Silveira) TaxID=443226 RepID=UPI001BEFAFA6|nr:hypothetical protein D8B26_000975 [Coccidioides posadasii str. Silveira]
MEPSIEVLVHISAPGDAEDDANHRALANAFLHFEPATKFRIYPDDSDGSDQLHILTQASNSDQENRGRCGSTDRSTPPWKRGIDAGYERDDSVFYDDFEERHSCDFYEGAERDTEIIPSPTKFNETDSFETPPATVPDSQPPFSPTWDVLKYAQRDGDSGTESPAGEISILEPIAATEEKPSEVPVSQGNVVELGSFEVPSESAFGSQFSFRSIGDPERSISPAMRSIKPVRIREPPSSLEVASPPKRTCLPETKDDIISLLEETIPSSELEEILFSDNPGSSSLPELPAEIRPPPPEASNKAKFTTHITPPLHLLSEKMGLSRFKPAHQTRRLGILERGYWYMRIPVVLNNGGSTSSRPAEGSTACALTSNERRDPVPWSTGLFLRFWNYLSKFVGQYGRAGWGVWCFCDSAKDQPIVDSVQPLDVRVYSWGETAPYIYLLLFLASHRGIKKIPNVQWRDGKGEVVIQMD